ncbi:MAG: thioredoxin-disulfide reductase [Candidatus Omnitrophota bacterium]
MHDLIILGAGPAGLTAALYAGRYRMDTLVLEKSAPGGQILLSATIENYPGFPGGIGTAELIENFRRQAADTGVVFETGEVTGVVFTDRGVTLETSEGARSARCLIIASGAASKRLGIKGELELTGRGVSYCATCDAPFFRNKDVLVVGGGDKALEEAIFLCDYASSVTVIHRRSELRAAEILQEKARAQSRLKFLYNSVLEEINGRNRVESVSLKDTVNGGKSSLACHGVFIFVGIEPNTAFLNNQLKTDASGFIITGCRMEASKEGVFACGDCVSKSLYQVVNACGEAAVAADSVHKYLLTRNLQ